MIEHSRENWRAKWYMPSNGASRKHTETNNKSYVGVVVVIVVVVVVIIVVVVVVCFCLLCFKCLTDVDRSYTDIALGGQLYRCRPTPYNLK